jgi:arginase
MSTREIVIVGVPIDSLGKPGGTELSPGVWRGHGIVEALAARDAGDLPVRISGEQRDPASGIVGYPTVVTTCEGVRDGLAPLLASGAFAAVLGGCCSLVPGVAAALRAVAPGPVGMAYVDGHLDTYDPRTSPTGEAADMPVAICAGLGDAALTGLGGGPQLLDPSPIALLAHRDTEEARGEGSALPGDLGIGTSIDCATVQSDDPGTTGERVAGELAQAAGRFWVSIDVDVLASDAMPATPVRQPGGLSLQELAELARPLVRHPACVGLDLLCYDPELDDAEHTSGRRLVELIAHITGD